MTQPHKKEDRNESGTELGRYQIPFDPHILFSLLHSVPLRIYAKDKDGKFIYANRQYCRTMGIEPGEIVGKDDFDFHPQDLADKYLADDKEVMSSGKTRIIEERWQTFEGKPHHVQVVKTPLVDTGCHGNIHGTLGVFWDIDAIKRARNQAEEERNFLHTLIDSIPSLIYVKDTRGRFVIANRAIAEFMGAESPDELIGKTDFDYYTEEVAQSFADIEKKIFETKEPVYDLLESFDFKGMKFWVNTSKIPSRNLNGEIVGLVGIGHDITHIKMIETQLRESEERYAAVVNQALEGIYLLDPHTKKVLDSNRSLQEMLGYTKEELLTVQAYDFIALDRRKIDEAIEQVIHLEDFTIGERPYRHKNGTLLTVEVSATLIHFGGKQAVLLIVRDISGKRAAEEEREKLKEQLRQAQKFEALGTLAGGVAHDLNNILSGVVSYPELLMNKLPQDSELRKPLEVIHDSGVRASTVVADLLTIARSAASTKQVRNLNSLVQEFIESPEFQEIKSHHQGVTFQCQLSEGSANILCSSVHIKKCLMNLVINASEAIDTYGDVTIRVIERGSEGLQLRKENNEKNTHVLLQVSDSGPGISPKDLERIFEPFYTKKNMGRSGTGLGLTVVWNTVNDHGGEIHIESSDTGTAFNLFFPGSADGIIEQTAPAPNLQVSEKNEHILIVDDEKILRDIASEMLGMLGYRVDAVSTGEEAISFVRQTPVDLLLIDMIMGTGLNGRETFLEIRKMYPEMNALIVSGFSEDEDVKEALKAGAKGFVQKPYLMNKLGHMVKDALKKD